MQQYYKVPDVQQRKVALGSLPGLPYRVKKSLQSIKDMFEAMDKPVQGQWLWEHEEEGQTYDAYKGQMHNEVDQKRKIIYIKPLEKIDAGFLKQLQSFCECFFFPMKIKIGGQIQSMKGVNKRINAYTEKEQYNAKDILTVLKSKLPPDAFCLIGVCMTDLYPRQQWNFVFGLASIRQRTGVFSFARYDERFFEQKPYEINYSLIKYRSMGVVAHEVTHMFGVRHCIFYKCIMNGSNHLQESSKKPMQLCVICLRKMQSNIKFDILERYIKLKQFYEEEKDARVQRTLSLIQAAIGKIQSNIKL